MPTIGGIAATGLPILGNTYWEKGKLLSRGIPYELLMDLKADKAYEGDPARQSYFCHMAGRCVSADELAFSAIRVMGITMQMGQAVGIGAALAAGNGMPVKEIPVDEVRSVLRAVDAFVERST